MERRRRWERRASLPLSLLRTNSPHCALPPGAGRPGLQRAWVASWRGGHRRQRQAGRCSAPVRRRRSQRRRLRMRGRRACPAGCGGCRHRLTWRSSVRRPAVHCQYHQPRRRPHPQRSQTRARGQSCERLLGLPLRRATPSGPAAAAAHRHWIRPRTGAGTVGPGRGRLCRQRPQRNWIAFFLERLSAASTSLFFLLHSHARLTPTRHGQLLHPPRREVGELDRPIPVRVQEGGRGGQVGPR